MEFTIGDTVKCIKGICEGDTGIVTKIDNEKIYCAWGDGTLDVWIAKTQLINIGEAMSLKQRIEALDNGWDKPADDLIEEIMATKPLCLNIQKTAGADMGRIIIDSGKSTCAFDFGDDRSFSFTDQCSKHRAFKDALLAVVDALGLGKDPKTGDKAEVEIEGVKWEAKLVRRCE